MAESSASLPFNAASLNEAKKRVTLHADLGNSHASTPAGSSAKATLPPAQAAVCLDKYGSRDDSGAFHLKTGQPAQWTPGLLATLAAVKLDYPEANDQAVLKAITKYLLRSLSVT